MSAIPTVKIRAGDSYAIINVCDFDPAQHKVFVEHEATVANNETVDYPPFGAEAEPAPNGKGILISGFPKPVDPPSVETILGPSEVEAALAPEPEQSAIIPVDGGFNLVYPATPDDEPVKQYRPGQFQPKRRPGRPRKE